MEGAFRDFSRPITGELRRLGLEIPTEIQEMAIPYILKGHNALLIAPTGMGKTEAAFLPILELLIRLRGREKSLQGISALYVTPLRSLNRDIFRRLVEIGERLEIKIEVRHGDTSQKIRKLQAESPPNILITTPETLQAILVGRKMRRHLQNVRWVVVDEIHEMAADKRGVQLSLALERLFALVGREFQRIGLSATIGDPEAIGAFLVGKGRTVKILRSEFYREMSVIVESPTPTKADDELAERLMIPPSTAARIRRIIELISQYRSTLVFTNTREHAESLASKLKAAAPQLPIGIHHGSLSKDVRIETEMQMKSGLLRAVICTSSLELGIDIGSVDFVIQYQSPKQVTRIVQRIGRSGHAVGRQPKGCIIAAWPDDILESAVILKKAKTGELEIPEIHNGALDALAHQTVGLALDKGSVTLQEAYATLTKAQPYGSLSVESFSETLEQMTGSRRLRSYDGVFKINSPQSYTYYFENLSMISDVQQYVVFDYAARRKIGVLDQEFIARRGNPGSQFILYGSVWQILNVNEERRVVEVESIDPTPAAVPAWEGEMIPVPFEIAREVGGLRRLIAERLVQGGDANSVLVDYPMDAASKGKVVAAINKQLDSYMLPHDRGLVVEAFENYIIIHVCFGDKVNKTLSLIIGSLLTAKTGLDIALQSDPYRIAFITPYPLDLSLIVQALTSLTPEDVPKILEAIIDRTELFGWRLWNNAKRFGVVSKKAEYNLTQIRILLHALKGTPVYKETIREICLENLDTATTIEIINLIRAGDIAVEEVSLQGMASPLAMPLLDKIAPHDLLRPVQERDDVLKLLKERLNDKTLKLICVFKGDWISLLRVKSLPNIIRCPKCSSSLIAITYKDDVETEKVVRKRVKQQKLSPSENHLWLTAWKSASLIQNYGKKAAIALAGRGIGPTTAARILSRRHGSDNGLLVAILRAEREYLRTRMFWD